jgi:hypothetical protein
LIHIYDVASVKPLVIEFYCKAWNSPKETRRVFEEIGLELTKYTLQDLPILRNLPKGVVNVYAGPIARAGCGTFRPSVIKLLQEECYGKGLGFKTFGLGLSRSNDPLHRPAKVYWNTLRDSKLDLTSSLILLYEIGEATGSTIEGAVRELETLNAIPSNIIFHIGAACIDQTRERLQTVAAGIKLVVGSRWRYDEKPGPTQYYLTHIIDDIWIKMSPRDWGRCVAGMKDKQSVSSFIHWIGETINLSPIDEKFLFRKWLRKIKEIEVRSSLT